LYSFLADAVIVFHFLFIVFAVGGGLLVIRWPKAAWVHLPAALWGAAVELSGWICPLTPLENHLRLLGGGAAYRGDFIERYLLPLVYPPGLTASMQYLLGGLVIAVNLIVYTLVISKWMSLRRRG